MAIQNRGTQMEFEGELNITYINEDFFNSLFKKGRQTTLKEFGF